MSNWNVNGRTGDKVEVKCDGDPYVDPGVIVKINDEYVEVFRVSRLRDGGTTFIHTSAGYITYPRGINDNDRRPIFNGMVVHE